jgi:hypothetical protein
VLDRSDPGTAISVGTGAINSASCKRGGGPRKRFGTTCRLFVALVLPFAPASLVSPASSSDAFGLGRAECEGDLEKFELWCDEVEAGDVGDDVR